MDDNKLNSVVYAKQVVEFVAVGSEFCRIIESAVDYPTPALVDLTRKILPLLYFKASLLPEVLPVLDEPLEKYVSEMEYSLLLQKWSVKLAEADSYYEVFDPEIPRAVLLSSVCSDIMIFRLQRIREGFKSLRRCSSKRTARLP